MSQQKVITVLGGSGYVGKKCIQTLLNNFQNIKVYSVSRSGNSFGIEDPRLEIIKGNSLSPNSFEDVINESTGIIHSIGVLLAAGDKYNLMNKETCLRVAEIANSKSKDPKVNMVYVSASRGLPFPLSVFFGNYGKSKRECEEKLLSNYSNLNPVILKPGFVKSSTERSWSVPLYHGVNLCAAIEKNLLNPISPKIGETLELPGRGIELDVLAAYAASGAVGELVKGDGKDGHVYSNDFMENNKLSLI